MRLPAVLCVGFALLTAVAGAQVTTIPLQAETSALTLLDQGETALTYRVEVGDLAALDVNTAEGTFTRLMLPGFHASKQIGAPELPMMNRLIEIPFAATSRIEVVAVSSRSIALADHGITSALFPAQPSMPKNADPADWPFQFDREAYANERVAQELVQVADLGRLRGARIGRLEVSPVEYFPAENRILVYEQIEFRVIFDGADQAAGDELKHRTQSVFFEPLYGRLDGYRTPHDEHPDLVREVVTMVVVTPPEFEAQLGPYVEWKTQRGFHTILAVTGTPQVGTTKESIQAYIHDLYNNPPAGIPAPSFVVFVGDIGEMPTWTLSGDSSDRPYCDVEGDLVPDIYYGRLSATNSMQLQAILDKTLMYDQFTMSDPSYLEEVCMIAGMDSGHGATHGNGQINYGTTYYFNAAHGIYSHTYLYPESGSHAADIVQHVSDGIAFINYTAHGSTTSWSNPSFTQANINGLQNYGKYCTAIANCCLTSSYEVGECFAETWLRAEEKGAIGYIGASNSTYWDEDYWFGIGAGPVSANPTYEETGLGAYDGAFHDHGEAMENWYVVNDALIFSGNLAVMEGAGNYTYYWNIYNLMGDPSLATYMGRPAENPVIHPPTIFTTWTSIEIEAIPNSYVGLTKDGILIGAGTVDETGELDLPIWADPLTPGTAHLVVMAQNYEPYEVDLNVIVPATVYIDPTVIDANVETEISVGVFEYDGITPRPGVEVWAEGLGYMSEVGVTDQTGYCSITVLYPYGPTLDIVCQDPLEPWELFREPIDVNAENLFGAGLWVTTEIGLDNSFALNLPGVLHATVPVPDHTLWALLNGEPVGSTSATELEITPDELGTVTGIIAVSGYDLFMANFPVIEAYGTLTGHVDAGGTPAAGAVVKGYGATHELVFEATANASGDYDMGEEILVASYTIEVDYFGYLHWEEPFFVNYGANVLDIDLIAAPAGVVTGTVTETGTGDPLLATIRLYRSDTGELYAETFTNEFDGSYTTPALPYFDYTLHVRAWHHIQVEVPVTIDEPVLEMDFALEPTIGDLLVIDDNSAAKLNPAKYDEKTGERIAAAYAAPADKAAADLVADLEDLGFTVTLEALAATDPQTWTSYDLIIVTSGANTTTLDNATFRTNLIDFVADEGHLLIEGGEVGYDHQGDANFAGQVLHIADWTADQSGSVTIADPEHALVSTPNVITGPITVSYVGYGDHDANVLAADATLVGSWTEEPGDGSIIAYDPNPAPAGGQIAFYCFNYSAMEASARMQLLENTITWLMTPEINNCAISGTVQLYGETNHSGVLVTANPGGGSALTGPSGAYTLPGLYAGTYTVTATKEGWSTQVQEITPEPGQHVTGVNFLLTPVTTDEFCEQPGLFIPDNNPTGVTDMMEIALGPGVTISKLAVYIDITHTYIGDLIVELTSPEGTSVLLHNRTGGSTANILGWYPDELEPYESLDAFIGEPCDGIWMLHVSDHAGADTGVLNEWCLSITHGESFSSTEPGKTVERLMLYANSPNPAREKTRIRFALPAPAQVDLGIFDVMGRRVATLISGELPAGAHQAIWQGRDDAGQPVAGAVYFYHLKVGEKHLTRKMLLLR